MSRAIRAATRPVALLVLLGLLVVTTGCPTGGRPPADDDDDATDDDDDATDDDDDATDDDDASDDDDSASGPNQPPQAFIDEPSDGATFIEGDAVVLSGHADDPEDGELAGVSLFWTSSVDGPLGTGASVTMTSPSLGHHDIVLTAVDSGGLDGLASISLTIAPLGSNLPPTVEIVAPADNASFFEGGTVDFEGTGTDPEDGDLPDLSMGWTSSVDGSIGTGATFSIDTLSVGLHTVTLTGEDSEGATDSDTITITVNVPGNDPPVASILAPVTGSTFVGGDTITFEGEADDPEDGALTGASLEWSSDLEGPLGSGELLDVTTLAAGSHAITLTATDSGGALGTDGISLTVLAPNAPPLVTITAPPNGSSYDAGDIIDFQGDADDPEDGALTGSSLTWQSNLDGPIGTGSPLAFASLSVGLHQVTLVGVDSGGATGSDVVEVTIDPSVANLPPIAQLTGPLSGETGDAILFDGSGSSDPDGSIVDYEFDFGDGTPVVSGGADTALHIFASAGTWLVTLTVTDDDGDDGQASWTIEVEDPVPVPEIVLDEADSLGSRCDLDVDAAGDPQIVFRNDTHRQLWHAEWTGSAWVVDMIDGPGFDVGGAVSSQFALAVEDDGTPHVAYRYEGSDEVRYATLSGVNWTREAANPTVVSDGSYGLDIALDPVNGDRPTIAFDNYTATYPRPAVTYRSGPGSWIDESYTNTDYYYDYYLGGLAFDSTGTAWMAYEIYDLHALSWTAAGGFVGDEDITDSTFGDTSSASVALDASERPIILHEEGIEHFDGSVWIHSDIEASDISSFDGAANASGDYYVGLRHGSDLEIVHADPGEFWEYEYQGPMDNTPIGVAVSPGGLVRACFFRSNNLMVFQDF